MNVGSILNEDLPSSVKSEKKEEQDDELKANSSFQRHSIVDLLNDSSPTKTGVRAKSSQAGSKDKKVSDNSNSENREEGKKKSSSPSQLGQRSTNQETGSKNIKEPELNAEIEKIDKLVATSKPKRYQTPPIWAEEWSMPNEQFEEAPLVQAGPTSSISNTHVFDKSSTVSVDLECSITGLIPPPSMTRTIAEWIYANFTEIPNDHRKYVELELKFGTIKDKRSGSRIDVGVTTECVYSDTSNSFFDMGVHEVGWNDMRLFLEDLERTYQEEIRKQGPDSVKPRRKFSKLETDMTDLFFQTNLRNEPPKSIRVSKDNALTPARYTAINKQKISSLFIHNPSSVYDLRLSLSLEMPFPEESIEPLLKKSQPSLTRIKRRTSWSHRPTVTRFDLTNVGIPKELKNKSGKKVVEEDRSYEVELEIDVLELFNGFDQFKNGTDSIRFEELVEIFINNARCLNNRVTKLAMNR